MAEYDLIPLGTLAAPEPASIAIGPFGSRMKAEVYVQTGVPVIRGTNITSGSALSGEWVYVSEDFASKIPNCIVKPGDLVFPHRGSIGLVALVGGGWTRLILSTSMMKFRPDPEKADAAYLYYYFRSDGGRDEILRFSSQVGTPGIGQPLSSLRKFRVPLPSLAVQKQIARLLGSLDDKIELNRRMNETLEAMAQAIFQDWFVDFGPTRRKLAGIADPVEIMGGLVQDANRADEIAALFPDVIDDSGVPAGWGTGKATDLIDFNPPERLPRGTIAPYSDMGSLPTRGSIADPPIDRAFNSGMRFRNGDTLFARITPCLENGKTAYVDFLTAEAPVGWGSTEFVVMRPRAGIAGPFAYLLARSDAFREHAIRSMTGTSGRQRAQADSLQGFRMTLAPPEVHSVFGEFALPIFQTIRANADQNQTLAATRDLLLPKLVSGEMRIADIQQRFF